MLNFYKRIWLHTGKAQILLIVLSLAVAALAAAPLRFQKDIINSLGPDLDVETLTLLCLGYLGVIVISNIFKFLLNYRSSILGEATIRMIRQRIYGARHQEVVPEQLDDMGTLTTIIAAESEEVGRFAGTAIANPLLQVGTLVSVISYIASTQPYLGLFLVAIVVPQAVIVLLLQEKVNRRVKERTLILRGATSAISEEDIAQIKEAQQAVMDDFDKIYSTRRGIFRLKLSMKFAMNLLNGIGLVGILMIGGLLMMEGRSDIGTVVASIAALERISDPWRQLLNFYKELSAVRVKFDLILGAQAVSDK
ncbi:ABC transporter transmembrane domain-containing protein [Shimia aestuarii]|uniref:ABC transporter transmembrane region n=1 Tax=Shimia aestuarii TaxID=254406 RepID=A0A1I4P155_9RHOB|nr:ABC transporter transmembrane domain-containing protein [Shimia aestuarii]SFM21405.1 ABC transporter transmembrane region [Shimia aestuarii]